MKRQLLKWASILAVSLAFLGMTTPLTAFADGALTIGAMEDGAYAVNITVNGGKGATVALSVNGEKQLDQDIPKAGGVVSAQAQQGDVIAVAVAPKTPNSYMVESFTATDSNGTAIECQSEKTVNDASSWYSSYEYTFTMPASNVAATCVLARSTWTQLTAYCAMGWEDFDFALTDESDELVVPTLTGISQQGVPCRKYIIQHGSYKYAMSNVKAGSTIDSGELVLNPGSTSLNWNPLTVMVEPADVKGLGLFGVAGCTCTRADGEEKLPIASSVDESGIYTATFLLRGGIPGVGSTDYGVSVTPKDERCSVIWKAGWEDNYNYTSDSINVTSQSTERCKAKAFVRASDVMVAQGQAITELGGYDPENYLEAQQAEITQLVADATEAIRAAETEDAVAAALASAKQALDAVETAAQAEEAAAPVAQAIAALPAAGELTAESADAVKAARAAYDALTDAEKAAVGEANLFKLESAEAAVEAAIARAEAAAAQQAAIDAAKSACEAAGVEYDPAKSPAENVAAANAAQQGKVDEANAAAEEAAKSACEAAGVEYDPAKSPAENVAAANAAQQAKLAQAEEAEKAAEARAIAAETAQKAAEQKASQASGLKANPMTAKAKAVKAKAKKKTTVKKAKAFTITGAVGKVSFYKVKGNAKISISKSGKVTVKKGLKKGKTFKVKVLVCADGDKEFAPASKTVILKVKVE